MADTPLNVTEHDVADKNLLLRFLRKIASTISGITQRISAVEAAPKPLTPAEISRQLSATGAAPLNVQNLLGTLRQPQVPGPQRTTSVPTGQVLQQLQDTQLIISSTDNGTTYNLYQVVAGNPNALIKLIGGVGSTSTSGGGNYMTLDTVQTVTTPATKTVNSVWTFSTQLLGGPGSATAPEFSFSTNSGSGIYSVSTGILGIAAGGMQVMTITSGHVGINTTAPLYPLHITDTGFNAIANRGIQITQTSTKTSSFGIVAQVSGAAVTNYGGYFSADNGTGNNYGMYVATPSSDGPNNYALYCLSSAQSYFAGRVGIQTSAPSTNSALDIAGNTQLSTGGVVTKYHGLNTAGEGVPYILYRNTISGNTTSLPSQTAYTATSTGDFRLNYYAYTTATGTGGPITMYALWNDPIGTKNPALGTFNLGINTYINGSQYFTLALGQAITFYTGAAITAGGYTVAASLERLS